MRKIRVVNKVYLHLSALEGLHSHFGHIEDILVVGAIYSRKIFIDIHNYYT